jgi:hypothetical protein
MPTARPLQLTAKQREFIQERLGRDHGAAELWAFPDLERQAMLGEIDADSGLSELDERRRNIRLVRNVDDEECEAILECRLFSHDLRWRGVARRLTFNSPGDLRTALSLEARIEWFERDEFGSLNGGCYPEAWTILRALAARDLAVAKRFFDVNDQPLKRGHQPTVLLYNGLLAVLTENKALEKVLAGSMAKLKAPEAYKSMHSVIGSILANDTQGVVTGLARVLASFRRLDLFEEDKIICFQAHGLAELALHKNPDLLGEFDIEQGLPWDADFFAWLRNESPNPTYPELTKKSRLLDEWLNRLQPPSWWKKES